MHSIVIPPISFLNTPILEKQRYHLLLSHLLVKSEYMTFYKERRLRGDYLILDNSAHEHGKGQGIEILLAQACHLHAQEVVLPDVLFDARGTVEATSRAVEYMVANEMSPLTPTSWMIVPQAKSPSEWVECLAELVTIFAHAQWRKPSVFREMVVGISKDYAETFGSLDVCLKTSTSMEGPVHLLGWPKPLSSLKTIARKYGSRIRSTDSGRPFTYAYNGVFLQDDVGNPQYPGRSEDFFTRDIDENLLTIATHNVEMYRKLVRGE